MEKEAIYPMGDHAVVVEFLSEISEQVNRLVMALEENLIQQPIRGVTEMIPSYHSLLISYEPQNIGYTALAAQLEERKKHLKKEEQSPGRVIEIPVCYSTRFGPDIPEAEKLTGLDRDEMIAIHSSQKYRIFMLGFLPGFPYLGGLDKRIHMKRLSSPRVKIPAGSVGIGGAQTGIYPIDSPGGWRLIGATPLDLYDVARENPVPYQAGDYIHFFPISIDEYYDIRQEIVRHTYQFQIHQQSREEMKP